MRAMVDAEVPIPTGLVLTPFRAVRYTSAAGAPARLADLVSPPYDVIGEAEAAALEAADPHNVVRLILPRDEDAGPEGRYEHAARALRGWVSEAGRDPDAFGLEARLCVLDRTPDEWRAEADEWRALGATHLSIDTMKAGLVGVDAHVAKLAEAKAAIE